jgi:hypothetical protein
MGDAHHRSRRHHLRPPPQSMNRNFLLFGFLLALLGIAPASGGVDIKRVEFPVQSYATIDLSGTKSDWVEHIVLDDQNKAVFGYNNYSDGVYRTFQWVNGTVTPLKTVSLGSPWALNTLVYKTFVSAINIDGDIWADGESFYDSTISGSDSWTLHKGIFTTASSSPFEKELPPPAPIGGSRGNVTDDYGAYRIQKPMFYFSAVAGPTYAGIASGCKWDDTLYHGQGDYALQNGTIIVTPQQTTIFSTNISQQDAGSAKVVPMSFDLSHWDGPLSNELKWLNANGWACGCLNNNWGSPVLWNGAEVINLPGPFVTINEQNDVLCLGSNDGDACLRDGSTGICNSLASMISREVARAQLRDFYPFALSNRATVSGTAVQPVLHILFTAQVRRSVNPEVWEYATFLLRLLSDGKTDLHETPVLDGISNLQIKAINSSGVIAALADPEGDTGPTAIRHAVLLVPVDVKFMKTNVEGWSDEDELPESRVILFDEKTRIRTRFSLKFNSLSMLTASTQLDKLIIKTSATKKSGVDYLLTNQTCTFASGMDSVGREFSDIRVELTRSQLQSLGCLPQNEEDGVDEQCWYDVGDDDSLSLHNLSDGRAFDSWGYPLYRGDEKRGHCTYSGNLKSTPPNSPLIKDEKSFLKAAGVEYIVSSFGTALSDRRQIANQADTFYFSGHGFHFTGQLSGDQTTNFSFTFGPDEAIWSKELKVAIIAGCSVLDIKDFRAQSFGWMSRLDVIKHGGYTSPGEKWENIGPKYFLGYCWKAPLDSTDERDLPSLVIQTYLAARSVQVDPIAAWGSANNPTYPIRERCINACAIDASKVPHEFWYWDETSGQPVWTKKTKGLTGW